LFEKLDDTPTFEQWAEFPDVQTWDAWELSQTELKVEQGNATYKQEEEERDEERTWKHGAGIELHSNYSYNAGHELQILNHEFL